MSESLVELTEDELRSRGGRKWSEHPTDVLPAWIADMDFLPAEPVRRAVRMLADNGNFAYGSQPSQVPDAFSRRMAECFDWTVSPRDVVVVADLVQAVVAALLAYTAPGDGVLITTPAYPPLLAAIRGMGRTLVDVPLLAEGDGHRLDLDGIRGRVAAGAVRVVLLCHPHNPTGYVASREELEELERTLEGTEVVVVSDEIHADLVFAGSRHIPFASIGPSAARRTVTLYSATKTFNLGGLRCGVLHLGSPELSRRFHRAVPDRLLGRVNNIGALATIVAWEAGQPWLDALLERLTSNRARVEAWAAGRPGVGMRRPAATYFAWLDFAGLPPGRAATPREHLLDAGRVALSPGADFGTGYERFARLNFATSPEILERILERLDAALDVAGEPAPVS